MLVPPDRRRTTSENDNDATKSRIVIADVDISFGRAIQLCFLWGAAAMIAAIPLGIIAGIVVAVFFAVIT